MDRTIQTHDNDNIAPTIRSHGELQRAFDFFNERLFGGALPRCQITMQRHKRALGYFARDLWRDGAEHRIHEISLHPACFEAMPLMFVMSVLVHEMVHHWHQINGTPGRRGYHNKEWARKMVNVGLIPSDTGQPGGKMTGESVAHFIRKDGPFHRAYNELIAQGFRITWTQAIRHAANAEGESSGEEGGAEPAAPQIVQPDDSTLAENEDSLFLPEREPRQRRIDPSNVKFICESCQRTARAALSMKLTCGFCELPMLADADRV